MIEIQELEGLGEEEIYDLLAAQEEKIFLIYIPKSTQLFSSSSEDISIDYLHLSYCGQKLKEISDHFEYSGSSTNSIESVLFEIQTRDLDDLASVLLELSYGFGNGDENDEMSFYNGVEDFAEDVLKGNVEPACPDFIDTYKEYRTTEADDEEESDGTE